MVSSVSLFLLFSLSLFLSLVAGDLAFIQRTCNRCAQSSPNVHYDFCVAALQSDPASVAADLQGLGIVATKLGTAKAAETSAYIEDQLKGTLDPPTKKALDSCYELYSNALDSLLEAEKSIEAQSYDRANIEISAAMKYPTTCEDGFKGGSSSVPAPLKQDEESLLQLCAIGVAITGFLAVV